ncbi:unnamed protein product [Rhizoctonia solani]|uniref:Uncharacterized protein n=1 Tax=Rhizoctonia solani TaxID=456999 RepID=A0A8H3HDF9_9AGAM|nr:unnamed protein product [Rhizoctonia solani]
MSTPGDALDFSQLAAGLADAANLLAGAAQQLSEAARAMGHSQLETHAVSGNIGEVINVLQDEPSGGSDSSDGQSDSEDESPGGDAYGVDSHIGTSNLRSFSPLRDDQSTSHVENNKSFSQGSMITVPDESYGTILTPGRYYIIIDEEFDILPMIAMYGSICRKMLCCMPFTEPSQSWRVLLSAISPSHEVFQITTSSSERSSSSTQYISSAKPSILIQSFESWQTNQASTSISDCLLVWGFLNIGEEQLKRIQDAVLSVHHTCAIVTSQEYERTNFKAYLKSLGFTEHPKSISFNKFFTTSLLARFRTTVQGVLQNPKFYKNIQCLYKEFIEFYVFPPSEDMWWPETEVARLANRFAARVLLRGREKDGSSRFKPDGMMIPVDRNSIEKFGLREAVRLGLILEANKSNLVPSVRNLAPPSGSATQRNFAPIVNPVGRWYIILEEAFDAVPFISFQVESNKRVVCFVSYGSSTTSYQQILAPMTNYPIMRPSSKKKSINKKMSTFNSLQAGILLLPGGKAAPPFPRNPDVVIYWGVPPEQYLKNHLNTMNATPTYFLLSSVDGYTPKERVTAHTGIQNYPESVKINSTGPQSLLHSYRDRARKTMANLPTKAANKIYNGQVMAGSTKSRPESIILANQFAARVLLHGKPEDGSILYPPIKPRPGMKPGQVAKELQPYVNQGLIRVVA